MKITDFYGYHQIEKKYADLLRCCQAKVTTRYALEFVMVEKGTLCTTDGRQLSVIYCEHKLPVGLYYLTRECLLLPTKDTRAFPKWQDVLLEKPKQIKIASYMRPNGVALGKAIFNINTSKVLIDLNLYEDYMKKLAKLQPSDVVLEMAEDIERPIQIRCKKDKDSFLFVLIPVSQA